MKTPVSLIGSATLFVLLLSDLLGCSLGPPQRPVEHTYMLNPASPQEKDSGNRPAPTMGTLLVSPPKAQPGFDTPRMVYSLRPHEISYYAVNRWADTPARMLMEPLMRALERSGLWRRVVQMPVTVRADYRLDSASLVLEHQFYSNSSRVRLGLRAQLIDLKLQTIEDSRDFEIFEAAPSDDPYGGVVAANRAAARLLEQITVWLDSVVNERAQSAR
jgi:cholesterol transport system auxiliary component